MLSVVRVFGTNGGFESQFVVLFETPVDFERFVVDGYDASADAGAMQGE